MWWCAFVKNTLYCQTLKTSCIGKDCWQAQIFSAAFYASRSLNKFTVYEKSTQNLFFPVFLSLTIKTCPVEGDEKLSVMPLARRRLTSLLMKVRTSWLYCLNSDHYRFAINSGVRKKRWRVWAFATAQCFGCALTSSAEALPVGYKCSSRFLEQKFAKRCCRRKSSLRSKSQQRFRITSNGTFVQHRF